MQRLNARGVAPAIAIALTVAVVAVAASVAATAPPTTLAPPAPAPVAPPEGYMTLVDDTGVLTMTVPQAWNDVFSSTIEEDNGVHYPFLEASPKLIAFENGFDVPGAWVWTMPYTQDPQTVIDDYGIGSGCSTIAVEPFARDTLTGLAQSGTGCGTAGSGLFKLVSASPPDQSVTMALIVQVAAPADQATFDLVLQSFGFAFPGAVSVATVPDATRPPMGTVPISPLTPGRGLDGPIDSLPAAVPGEITVLGVYPEPDNEAAIVLFRNGTDQPIADIVLEGRIYAPDGSVALEVTESDSTTGSPAVVDPGGLGFLTIDAFLFDLETLPVGFTHDLTVRSESIDDLMYVPLETTGLSIETDHTYATITNPWEVAVPEGFGPEALCLDAAGTVLGSAPGGLPPDVEVDMIEPGASVVYDFEFWLYDLVCANVLVANDVFAP